MTDERNSAPLPGETPEPLPQAEPGQVAPEAAPAEAPAAPSIFDKPTHAEKKPVKKKRRGLTAVIAVVLVAAIAAGTVLTTKYLKNTDPQNSSSATSSGSDFSITLLDYSGYLDSMDEVEGLGHSGVQEIELKNAEGTLHFKQTLSKQPSTDAEGKETTETVVGWLIDGYQGITWDSNAVIGLVTNSLTVTALMEMKNADASAASYKVADGKEEATVTVRFKDESGYVIHIGSWSPDKSGRYIRLDNSDKVYLSSYSLANYAGQAMKDFVSTSALAAYQSTGTDSAYYEDGVLTYFDSILMGGRHFNSKVFLEFYPSDQTVTYTYYKMSIWQLNAKGKMGKSFEMPTNDDRVYQIFDLIVSGFAAEDIYGFYPDAKTLEEYGLDVTLYDIVYKINNVNYRIQIGDKQEDGLYPVRINETPVIYACSASVFPFLTYKQSDYYRNQLYLCNVDDMASVRVQYGTLDETFVITQIPKKDSDTDTDQTVALSNGKSVQIDLFRTFLSEFMKTQAISYAEDAFADYGKAKMTVTISYVNKELKNDVITFLPYSDRRYCYRTNGGGDALVKSDTVESIYQKALAAVKSAK